MAERKKRVSIQYRRAAYPVGETRNWPLEQLLTEAMRHVDDDGVPLGDTPRQRHMDIPGYGTLVLNAFEADSRIGFFMELVRFEPGADLTLLEMTEGAASYNLKQAKAPDGHEPFKGVLYFLARGNDVVLLEQDVSGLRAEQYTSWLLSDRTAICARDSRLLLDSSINREGSQKLAEVKTVHIRPQPVEPENSLIKGMTFAASEQEGSLGRAARILQAAGMDEAAIANLTADVTNIEVTLQLRFKGDRSFKTVPGPALGRMLRNIDQDELTLEGPAGRE